MSRAQRKVSSVLRHSRLQGPLRVAAWTTWVALAILSVAPGALFPRAGMSGASALGTAYGLSGFVTRLSFRHRKSRWQIAAFATAAAVLSASAFAAEGGAGTLRGWVAASAGALVGIVIARAVDHLSRRPEPRS